MSVRSARRGAVSAVRRTVVAYTPSFGSVATATNSGGTTITAARPNNSVAGDLLLAFHVSTTGGGISSVASAQTVPTGWVALTSASDNAHTAHKVFFADGAVSSLAFPKSADCDSSLVVARITGVSQNATKAVNTSFSMSASTTNIAAPSVDSPGGSTLLLCSVGCAPLVSSSLSGPTNMVLAANPSSGVYAQQGLAYSTVATAGATGTRTFVNSADGGGAGWTSISVVIS